MAKKTTLTFVILTISSTLAFAGGNLSGGGDTQCEKRINDIQVDLAAWLQLNEGGPHDLNLHGLKFEAYRNGMAKFAFTEPECTSEVVSVVGTEKTCKFETTSPISGRPRITCNTDRFNKTEDYKQYQLIHHEIAGLAGLEMPNGSKSRYDVVSDQISDFLESVTVKKLAVAKQVKSKMNANGSDFWKNTPASYFWLEAYRRYGNEGKFFGCVTYPDLVCGNIPTSSDIEEIINTFLNRREIWLNHFQTTMANYGDYSSINEIISDLDNRYKKGNALSLFYKNLISQANGNDRISIINKIIFSASLDERSEFLITQEHPIEDVNNLLSDTSVIVSELRKLQQIVKEPNQSLKEEMYAKAMDYDSSLITALRGFSAVIRAISGIKYPPAMYESIQRSSLNPLLKYIGCEEGSKISAKSPSFEVKKYLKYMDVDRNKSLDPLLDQALLEKLVLGGAGNRPLTVICIKNDNVENLPAKYDQKSHSVTVYWSNSLTRISFGTIPYPKIIPDVQMGIKRTPMKEVLRAMGLQQDIKK